MPPKNSQIVLKKLFCMVKIGQKQIKTGGSHSLKFFYKKKKKTKNCDSLLDSDFGLIINWARQSNRNTIFILYKTKSKSRERERELEREWGERCQRAAWIVY